MRAIGIILAGGQNEKLGELTKNRATSAMPVGSSYRAIDFSLSNMVNSGINKVAVITQFNSRSLHDHLNSSKWWGFGRKHGGLFVFSPFLTKDGLPFFRGTGDSIFQNISFLKRSNEPYVVITSGDGIYKMDYNRIIDFHEQKNADFTVVCKEVGDMDVRNFGVVSLDEHYRLIEFEEKPLEAFSDTISLGIYVIKRELLIEILEKNNNEGRHDLVRDIIARYRKRLNIFGLLYDGYWSTINTTSSYYNINMDFLRADIRANLLLEEPFIETKNKDEPPAKYNFNSRVKNALVGSGSIIDGTVEDSVLFRGVRIMERAFVSNSIVMEGCEIGNDCVIEYAILDKEVVLTNGITVRGTAENPRIIPKGSVI